jgi:hypothetical protein
MNSLPALVPHARGEHGFGGISFQPFTTQSRAFCPAVWKKWSAGDFSAGQPLLAPSLQIRRRDEKFSKTAPFHEAHFISEYDVSGCKTQRSRLRVRLRRPQGDGYSIPSIASQTAR